MIKWQLKIALFIVKFFILHVKGEKAIGPINNHKNASEPSVIRRQSIGN